ncbi:hypothetical protein [Actinomadura opuntiae]|uniref:hypothetical protein n=1 Tax=Actinomadura sp. OS1-43 TaxID=604315 RepID=UPI00255A7D8E|nr:hypothetical protein [Actinomadura sp. OS1-43]MDL4818630.1 hypothetical protein [Actinomadura sp. OS1-43]
MHDGRIIPAAIGLSHEEQFQRLAEGCPDAVSRAFLAGDPCYDRMLASAPRRLHYRHAFHLRPGQRLITVNSTWRENSLFGLDPLFTQRLLSELPFDEFRVALILHPNVWASHGAQQIESWLFDARRAGLILLPPQEGWRAAVVASDWVLSDHGSVGMYAAAVGRPVLLEQSGRPGIDPHSGLGRLFDVAPPLDPHAPIRPQLEHAERMRERTHEVAATWISSAPEKSLQLIRDEVYRIFGDVPPATGLPRLAVPSPTIDDALPTSLWTRVEQGASGKLSVHRTPATVAGDHRGVLLVSDEELDHRLTGTADIIRITSLALPADEETWSAAVFEHRIGVQLTIVHDRQGARVRTRNGACTTILLDSISHPDDAELLFAVLAERILTAGPDAAALSPLTVHASRERTISAEFHVRTAPPPTRGGRA